MNTQEAIDTILSSTKVAVIMRGCSGSGKSTFVEKLTDTYAEGLFNTGKDVPYCGVHSTDSFRYVGEQYVYRPEDNGKFHAENLKEFTCDLMSLKDLVICDNTNTTLLEFGVYCQISVAFGYTPFVVTTCNHKNLEENAKRNLHGVPLNSIINQYNNIVKFDKQIKKQWNPLWVKE